MVTVCMITIFEKSKRLKTLDDKRKKRSNTTNQLVGKSESSLIRWRAAADLMVDLIDR